MCRCGRAEQVLRGTALPGGMSGEQRVVIVGGLGSPGALDRGPLPDVLEPVRAGEVLAVAGFGPAALEVVAAATLGRGGRFDTRRGRLRYRAGGAEPSLVLYSRSGLPYHALPDPGTPRYPPRRCTPEVFAALREARPGGRIDLAADLLPLLHADMREAAAECAHRTGRPYLDPVAALHPLPGDPLTHAGASHRWWRERVAADLAEAARGVAGSPVEAGFAVLREVWDALVAVAGPPPDHLRRAVARVIAGPPPRRHVELLALADAGLLRVPLGPSPAVTPVDAGWRLTSTALRTPIALTADWLCPATP
jgi:hypothetical protein